MFINYDIDVYTFIILVVGVATLVGALFLGAIVSRLSNIRKLLELSSRAIVSRLSNIRKLLELSSTRSDIGVNPNFSSSDKRYVIKTVKKGLAADIATGNIEGTASTQGAGHQ